MRSRISGLVATLAIVLGTAAPAIAQRQPIDVNRVPGYPGYHPPASGVRSPRPRVFLPGRPPTTGSILRPGAQQPDPERRIILAGQEHADPTRRIIVPGAAPNDGRSIVAVQGRSLNAMIRALRSVGEHRLAARLCQQAGGSGCGASQSVRSLNAATRHGAVNISNDVLTDTPRHIYTAGNRFAANEDDESGLTQMPRLQRVHGRNDPAAQRAFDKAGVVLAFYRNVLGRRSHDDRNGAARFIIHYGVDHDNAAWSGPNEATFPHSATFGDGDALSRPQYEGETPYHEFTHGVVDATANFTYEGEGGALHEHFADVLGETVQQWELGHNVHEATWLAGEGTYHLNSPDGATRSLRNPGLYEQHPGHMREWRHYSPQEDNGGVHALAGIPNRAFYLAARQLGGHSWEHVGVIWYTALRDFLGPGATFRETARATVRAAAELFGPHSREAAAVRSGWLRVGLPVR